MPPAEVKALFYAGLNIWFEDIVAHGNCALMEDKAS
jgi:hypothetical protein